MIALSVQLVDSYRERERTRAEAGGSEVASGGFLWRCLLFGAAGREGLGLAVLWLWVLALGVGEGREGPGWRSGIVERTLAFPSSRSRGGGGRAREVKHRLSIVRDWELPQWRLFFFVFKCTLLHWLFSSLD